MFAYRFAANRSRGAKHLQSQARRVEETVRAFMRAMQSGSQAARVRRYIELVFNHDDLQWVAPRHADELWHAWEPMRGAIAEAVTQHYQSTMLKPGADEIKVAAYPIGRRSRYWSRFRDAYKRFPRLPLAYWVKVVAPWYEHHSMPYLHIRGRVIFWPGLDTLPEAYHELDDAVRLSQRASS
jgi:hypothetical protein